MIASDLLTGARYIKLGLLGGVVETSRWFLRRARLEMWETKKELGTLPPPSQMADEILRESCEEYDDSPPDSFPRN